MSSRSNRRSRRRPRRNNFRRNRRAGLQPAFGMQSDVKLPPPKQIAQAQVVSMTFRNILNAQTDGSGNFAAYLQADPSSTTTSRFGSATLFTEFSSVAGLWNLVKLVQFEVYLTPTYIDETKGDDFPAMAIATNLSPAYTTPSSFQQVADNGDSSLWQPFRDFSGKPHYHAFRWNQRTNPLGWATTATPNPGSSYAGVLGCPGSIIFYTLGLPVSTQIFTIKIVGHYLFTNRV